ncbi:MAG: hypothetical protein HYZ57_21120 [Acidobacteria bacterium]|nr:hypothetical protein [Acidobacteriota bacterium]MBI3282328.1 hypothetical protein [Acidobacteriota bacterium]
MIRYFPAVALALIPVAFAAPRRVVFEGPESEHKWTLKDLNPELPSDWTRYDYLVLELRASSPQRFWLTLYSSDRVQRRQMHPFPNVWIRAAVPLEYYRRPNRAGFDLASVGKVPRNSFWISTGGVYGPLNAVDAIGVTMQAPLGKPALEIRSVRLSKEDPRSDVLDKKPVVDEFGQWIPEDWPGKAKTLIQLKKEWSAEEAGLAPGDFGYCKFGGYLNTKAKATGFFRVEQVDGRWWFVDPDGHLFFSTSSTGMGAGGGDARLRGREDYFAALPPVEATPVPGRRPQTGFYAWNLARRHGHEWKTKWIDLAIRRMESWGLNTIGNWSDPRLWDAHKKAYVVNLRGWGMETGYMGMPDVFSAEFPKIVDAAAAAQCAPRQSDPYLLGYFIANEPPWPGRESLVVDVILDRPPSAIQREAKAFLAAGDTPERRKQFIYRAFDKYLEVINSAIRRHDPNHLNLGLRFGGSLPPAEMLRASKAFDVYSMNVYSTAVSPKVMQEIYGVTGRPILVGEFHFGVPGRGLAAGLVQVRDQAERGVAYRYYVEQAAAFPAFIGSSWFQWVDQPSTGRMDGENYNIGLVDVTGRPYRELIEAMKTTHRRLQAVHAGKTAPFSAKPRAQ